MKYLDGSTSGDVSIKDEAQPDTVAIESFVEFIKQK